MFSGIAVISLPIANFDCSEKLHATFTCNLCSSELKAGVTNCFDC